jgi:hypothetical protein
MYINEVAASNPRNIETVAVSPSNEVLATGFYSYKTKDMTPLSVKISSCLPDGKVHELQWITKSKGGKYFLQTDKYGTIGGSSVYLICTPEDAASQYVNAYTHFVSFENAFPMVRVIKEEDND